MEKKIQQILGDVAGNDESKRKAAILQLDSFKAVITEEYRNEVRNYDPSTHGDLIPLINAALLPFIDQEDAYRPMSHLMMRLLNAMVNGEFPVYHDDTKIPLHEYMKLGDVLPDGTLREIAPFHGVSLVHTFHLVCWFTRNGYPFAADVAKKLGYISAEEASTRLEETLPKERESLLRLIIAMAVAGYRYDPKAKRSDVTPEICKDLESLGIPLDPDTVRKWLREAAQLLNTR